MESKEIQLSLPSGMISGKAYGDPSSMPVLLIHGAHHSCSAFDDLMSYLPQTGFYYIAIDLPGHGRSSHCPYGYYLSLVNYSQSVISIIDKLNLKKFIIIGHSLGAHISCVIASAFPNLINKVVLIDPTYFLIEKTKNVNLKFAEIIKVIKHVEERLSSGTPPSYTYNEAVRRIMNTVPNISERGANNLAKRGLIKIGDKYRFSADQGAKIPFTFLSFEQIETCIHNIRCPTLTLLSDESVSMQEKVFNNGEIKELFKNNNFLKTIIINGNHNLHLNNADKIGPLINKFLLSEKNSL